MINEIQVAHIIYLRRGTIVLSKVVYSNWHSIQDDYEDYMTSFGPWDVDTILSFFEEEFKEESAWVFTKEQIRSFMESQEFILKEERFKLTDLLSKTATTIQFNNFINELDIVGLSSLMSDDHTFIDSAYDVHEGKELMTKGWQDFFNQYPDYRNIFEKIEMKQDGVVMIGHSVCSYSPLDGPALWSAQIRDGQVAEWRVYLDTPETREKLGIE